MKIIFTPTGPLRGSQGPLGVCRHTENHRSKLPQQKTTAVDYGVRNGCWSRQGEGFGMTWTVGTQLCRFFFFFFLRVDGNIPKSLPSLPLDGEMTDNFFLYAFLVFPWCVRISFSATSISFLRNGLGGPGISMPRGISRVRRRPSEVISGQRQRRPVLHSVAAPSSAR